MTFAIHTLGCRVNIYESEKIRSGLIKLGFKEKSFSEKADIYIINTCSVTHVADHKSRQMLSKARNLNEDALILCVGCYADNIEINNLSKSEGVIYIDNKIKNQVIDYIENLDIEDKEKLEKVKEYIKSILKDKAKDDMMLDIDNIESRIDEVIPSSKYSKYFLKIEDGCNHFCTYCLIPHLRGRVESKPIEKILKEAEDVIKSGCLEIVLVGINLCSYGLDLGSNLNEVIKAISNIEGLKRLRLSSLTPSFINDEFIETIKLPQVREKLCNSFHLSLQSASDNILKKMNRNYTKKDLQDACDRLRNTYEFCTITADIIVGFPGESDEDFKETYDFVQFNNIYSPHIFPYSIRKGTRAEKFEDQVPEEIKKDRTKKLIALGDMNSKNIEDSIKGMREEVLVEQVVDGYAIGHTRSSIELKLLQKKGVKVGEILSINI